MNDVAAPPRSSRPARGTPHERVDAQPAPPPGAAAQPAHDADSRCPGAAGARSVARRPRAGRGVAARRAVARPAVRMPLRAGGFGDTAGTPVLRALAHGFTWLRDLRALGTDAARMRARALVADWMTADALDPHRRTCRRHRRAHRGLARPLRLLRRLGGRRFPPEADGPAGRRRARPGGGAARRGAGRPRPDRGEGPGRGGGGAARARRLHDPRLARAAAGDQPPGSAGRLPRRAQSGAAHGGAAGPDRDPRAAAGRAGAAAAGAGRRHRAHGAGPAHAPPRRRRARAVQRHQGGHPARWSNWC